MDKVKEYNERHGMELAKISQTENGETSVAICDSFCRRVHENFAASWRYCMSRFNFKS